MAGKKKKQYGTLVLERRDLEDKILGLSEEYAVQVAHAGRSVQDMNARTFTAEKILRLSMRLGILIMEMKKRVADGEGG